MSLIRSTRTWMACRRAAVEPSVSTATTRALRRRMEQQQRTIRALTIGLFAAVGLVLVIAFLMMAARNNAQTNQSDQPSPSSNSPAASADTDATTSPDADRESGDVPETSSEETNPSVIESEEYTRAVELIEAASKGDRPVDERIKDLEEARILLTKVAADVTMNQRPADLEDRLKHVNSELDRLRLQKMFP